MQKDLDPEVGQAKERFERLLQTFEPDANVDTIFEVSIGGKSVEEIEKAISDGQEDYFVSKEKGQCCFHVDGFSQQYQSLDREWKKTIKVTTKDFKGRAITPYLQIFYEDKLGGVVRLKPNGNPAAPKRLTHLQDAHGTKYFKLDPKGDLSYENEAFKVHARQPVPKAPTQVKLPEGVEFGSPQAEEFLKQCWTYRTHAPLSSSGKGGGTK